jgi:hypothetical protein
MALGGQCHTFAALCHFTIVPGDFLGLFRQQVPLQFKETYQFWS